MRRLKLCYLFFVSTLKINIPLSVAFSYAISKGDWGVFLVCIPSFLGGMGLVATILYKELFEKDAYNYYRNAGIPKRYLIVSVFAIYWFIIGIIKLCVTYLK